MAKKKTALKKSAHHAHKAVAKTSKTDNVTLYVQGWMFIVAFALMLGIGAIVGTYFSGVLNGDVPMVAGAQTTR